MNKSLLILFAAAALFAANGSVRAQEETSQEATDAATAAEVADVDMDETRFFDANNDGVNDFPPRMTREQLRELDEERRQNRGQLMNQAMAGLTKAQKDEIARLRTNMRTQGATPDQIHMAVGQKVRSFGVDVPEGWNLTAREYDVHRRMTDEERAQVNDRAKQMREEGKTNAEVRSAVSATYREQARTTSGRATRSRVRDGSAAGQDSARAVAAQERAQMRQGMGSAGTMRDSMAAQVKQQTQAGRRAGAAGQSSQRGAAGAGGAQQPGGRGGR